MTAKELAEMLSGREVGEEIVMGEERDIKDAGLVVVYGYSDDNVEFCGAINDEVGSYDGDTVYLTKNGILEGPACSCAEDCECPYFVKERERPRLSRLCGTTRAAPAGRLRRTSPTRPSPSRRTVNHGASGSCSA